MRNCVINAQKSTHTLIEKTDNIIDGKNLN